MGEGFGKIILALKPLRTITTTMTRTAMFLLLLIFLAPTMTYYICLAFQFLYSGQISEKQTPP
jgi:hypothetical protein